MDKQKKKYRLSTFGILIIVMLLVSLASILLAGHTYTADGETAEVVGAKLSDILLGPVKGFQDAIDVIGFVFMLGIFLKIVDYTGALKTGIHVLVKKMKGRETALIPILMFIFSVGGTTYGMGEETVGFYILLSATMLAAGMDPIVGSAVVLLGAGSGVLGSTINPFATGAAISAAHDLGIEVNTGICYIEGVILWLVALGISIYFVMRYAKKILKDKGSMFLSEQEMEECRKAYGDTIIDENVKLTGRQKTVLWIFALTFVVMILGFIPWMDLLGEDQGLAIWGWSDFLTGNPLGWWWFDDAATWFLLMGLLIALIGLKTEDRANLSEIIVEGLKDMISVNTVIALARATTVIMSSTGLGPWLVEASVKGLTESGMSKGVFGALDYLLHIGLSFLVPSSSGLAGLSSPIVSPIMSAMGWSVETSIMIMVAANGLVNLITPTCGFIMGGLALARVPYAKWVQWGGKVVLTIGIACGIILVVAMSIL